MFIHENSSSPMKNDHISFFRNLTFFCEWPMISWIKHNWPFLNTNFTLHSKSEVQKMYLWWASSVSCHKNVADNLRSRVQRGIKIGCFIADRVCLFVHNCYVNLNSPDHLCTLSAHNQELHTGISGETKIALRVIQGEDKSYKDNSSKWKCILIKDHRIHYFSMLH